MRPAFDNPVGEILHEVDDLYENPARGTVAFPQPDRRLCDHPQIRGYSPTAPVGRQWRAGPGNESSSLLDAAGVGSLLVAIRAARGRGRRRRRWYQDRVFVVARRWARRRIAARPGIPARGTTTVSSEIAGLAREPLPDVFGADVGSNRAYSVFSRDS
jgi:hypothetical protein